MPRTSRQKSKTRIYHIVIRGINQQLIFEEEQDKEKFIDILKDCKTVERKQGDGFCVVNC